MTRRERNYHKKALERALRQGLSALRRYSKALEDLGTGSLRLAESRQEWCQECDHPFHRGDCQVEVGDQYESGMAPMARGQCGCKGRVN